MYKIAMLLLTVAVLSSCAKDTAPEISEETTNTTTDANARVSAAAATVNFSGYTWQIRQQGLSAPGPNYWSSNNVWVDSNGWLHLKISRDAATGLWYCAEVISNQTFGYGTYLWEVEGAVDKLDRNIVLGLFNYKSGDNGHHEIDIEFARWGNDAWHNYNYTVYPATGSGSVSQTNELKLNGTYTTHTFTRNSTSVSYKGYHGFTTSEANAFFPWTTPAGYNVSTLALPIHMNLWLFSGQAPANGAEVEIIIHSFRFIPA
ncbi:glycoside hydrolase family 16 protein [Chitinophaga tropicalis]|uniref:GH16 domain-containing protein n=1 Tax=Chitinophaga tropicalis TaxID=2683588 RepID=A0A7K1U0H4_9BACT|nr:glycoside hydrolase family 16 protein [Chitinophaga tropicalis]MVT07800.1 hypothetical protein [Chitinophaga tropicalis]